MESRIAQYSNFRRDQDFNKHTVFGAVAIRLSAIAREPVEAGAEVLNKSVYAAKEGVGRFKANSGSRL